MRRAVAGAGLCVLVAGVLLATQPEEQSRLSFEPVRVRHAVGPTYPLSSSAEGTVILRVTVNRSGDVARIDRIHDIPPLTEEAERAVRRWEFQPAKLDGTPLQSSFTASFTFVNWPQPAPPWEGGARPEMAAQFQPVQIISVARAPYPFNVAVSGTVILAVAVGRSGDIGHIDAIRGAPPLTAMAERALGKWKLRPAKLSGRSVTSVMLATFEFRVLTRSLPCCPR